MTATDTTTHDDTHEGHGLSDIGYVKIAIALAIVSAIVDRPLPSGLAVFGEVGLGGEIRQASRPDRRLAEAERLGFDRILVPERTPSDEASSRLVRVEDITAALAAAQLID